MRWQNVNELIIPLAGQTETVGPALQSDGLRLTGVNYLKH